MNKFKTTVLFACIFAYAIVSKSDEGFDTDFSRAAVSVQKSSNNVLMLLSEIRMGAPQVGSAVFLRFVGDSHKYGYFLTARHVVKQCALKQDCRRVLAVFNGAHVPGFFNANNDLIGDGNGPKRTMGYIKIVAINESSDLVIFKARLPKGIKLEEIILAQSVEIGEHVYSVGYPAADLIKSRLNQKSWIGTRKTLSSGKVIASKKKLQTENEDLGAHTREMLITNVDTLPGNSGGAVFNEKGELAGIASTVFPQNLKKYSLSETDWRAGSFAIPVSTIQELMASIGLK